MFSHENLPVEQQLKAVYEDGVFRPLEPVDLDEHQQVTLAVEIIAPNDPESDDEKPIWEIALEFARNVPESELEKLPRDGAAQHDHYLYGSPKRD